MAGAGSDDQSGDGSCSEATLHGTHLHLVSQSFSEPAEADDCRDGGKNSRRMILLRRQLRGACCLSQSSATDGRLPAVGPVPLAQRVAVVEAAGVSRTLLHSGWSALRQ